MATIMPSNSTRESQLHNQEAQAQGFSIQSTNNPIKVQAPDTNQIDTRKSSFFKKFLCTLFYIHFILIAILVIFLTVRGLFFDAHKAHFHPRTWYPPLLASIASGAVVGFTWQLATCWKPSTAIKAAFRFSPLLTCAVGILLIAIGSAGGLVAGVISLVSAIIQALYSSWVNPRLDYAVQVVSVSVLPPPTNTTILCIFSIIVTTIYSCFLVSGIGGATATGNSLGTVFILVILLSLTWTTHIIKNTLQVVISRIKYAQFTSGIVTETKIAFRETIKHSMGSVIIGSVLVPILGVVRGSARATSLISGDADEFMFSCVDCYTGIASKLVQYGNRWGFVHVGVYNKGFLQASTDTWESFTTAGLIPLIDSDLTSSFCFLCGVAGGSVCTLVCGSWALAVHRSYATELSIYAFLIGYFMSRIAMAWPQASVSAYYVAYAENPQSQLLDSTIPVRIQELQRSQV